MIRDRSTSVGESNVTRWYRSYEDGTNAKLCIDNRFHILHISLEAFNS
jgi:hypothetical protein